MPDPLKFSGRLKPVVNFKPWPGIQHVLFDFDGTLSLLRQSWPEVMVPLFVEELPPLPDETTDDLHQLVYDDIMQLNGKQTIYQMIQLADRIRERGGEPRDPLWYKHKYLRQLDERIADRKKAIEGGRAAADEFLVHQSREALEILAGRGLTLHLASGTDEQYVIEEAELLGIAHFFQGRIHGARDDYENFSKKMVIDQILASIGGTGEQLLSFGDGYVEIQNTKQAGGLAVAVASDEANNGSGNFDPWKLDRLSGVGADVVIPDFRDFEALLMILLGE